MAHVILGLLLIAPRSLYDLIKGFESGVALFYSASSGSIKRSLDALLEQGRIEVAHVEPGGRGRKTYRVTDAGRAHFHEWIRSTPSGSDIETAALSRLYFLGLVPPDERGDVLRAVTGRIEADLATLTRLEDSLESVEVPADLTDVARFQRATLDYGLASHRFAAKFLTDLADDL